MERRPGVSPAHSGVDVLGRAVGEREADLGHVAPADGLDQVLGARYPAQPSQPLLPLVLGLDVALLLLAGAIWPRLPHTPGDPRLPDAVGHVVTEPGHDSHVSRGPLVQIEGAHPVIKVITGSVRLYCTVLLYNKLNWTVLPSSLHLNYIVKTRFCTSVPFTVLHFIVQYCTVPGDVGPEVPVDARALDAHQHTQVKARPVRVWGVAVHTPEGRGPLFCKHFNYYGFGT